MCGAVTPQVGNDDAVAGLCEKRRHLDEAVDVVGPSVEQNDGGTVRRAGLGVTNVQQARFDLLERRKCANARPNPSCRFIRLCFTFRWSNSTKLRSCQRRGGKAEKIASAMIDILGHLNSSELNGLILLVFFRSSPLPGRLDERLLLRGRLPPCGRHMDAIWSARALSSPDRDRLSIHSCRVEYRRGIDRQCFDDLFRGHDRAGVIRHVDFERGVHHFV